MSLVEFFIALVVLGPIFYLVDAYVPMARPFKTVLRIGAVVVLIFMILALFRWVSLPFSLQ